MPLFTPTEISGWVEGRWENLPTTEITGVGIDTRSLRPGMIYVALRGRHFDGHEFVKEAFNKGAAGAVVKEDFSAEDSGRAPLLRVRDPAGALVDMAAGYRAGIKPLVLGVTGSAGKTTVKEMTADVLSSGGKTARTMGNYNNNIGLPLSILNVEEDATAGVFEVASNHPGEIGALSKLLKPDWGVVTTIGPAHIQFFGSLAGIAREKSSLLKHLPENGKAFLDRDERFFELLSSATGCEVVTIGVDNTADYKCVARDTSSSAFTLLENATGEKVEVTLRSPGEHNVRNAMFALAVGRAQGLDWEPMTRALSRFAGLKMRWEEKDVQVAPGVRVKIVNDAYNANPLSSKCAIEAMAERFNPEESLLVLGGMLELGTDEGREHRELGEFVAGRKWGGLVTVGPLGNLIADGASDSINHDLNIIRCADIAEAVAALSQCLRNGNTVLLKASRGIGLEKILEEIDKEPNN